MTAFLKKEWMEVTRTGRGLILLLAFVLFGIMNPAIAKLTPWMMKVMADSLEEAGFVLTEVTVDAMTSWTQFYKNIPMALIVFVLLCSGIFTTEYQRGTLIPVVTKGLSRRKILAAKAVMLTGLWSAGYFLCYGITLAYNAWFWDNSIAAHHLYAAVCYWMFGMWIISLMLFFSALAQSSTQVLLGTCAAAVAVYVMGMFPKIADVFPSKLMDGMSLLQGAAKPGDYRLSMVVALMSGIACVVAAVVCFDRKRL